MPRYQIRDTATGQLLALGLADYAAAEAALDRLDDELEQQLWRNGEGARRIRLRLDIEELTATGTPQAVGHHVLLLGTEDQADEFPLL
ncbi:hypothetical protein ABZ656_49900 [Streptomyces sp. NPDC007095]|jgi:hypothetical protein|uniref:hypothetical protein n=1 Tax=Streptomyces sp. NPDC007095 TaxID=3154482 RepID=UPI000C701E34